MRNKFILTSLVVLLSIAGTVDAQQMASPAAKAEGKAGKVKITVDYSQPSAKGRKIMGALVPYNGEIWRTGANDITALDFDGDVKIEGQALPKGKYGLFTIPAADEWTIVINKDATGSPYDYSKDNDVLRVKVKPAALDSFVETFTITVENGKVNLKWENTVIAFKVEAK